MGRFEKEILDVSGIDKRVSGYYSTPIFVAEFLTKEMLYLNPEGKYVLDPAVGKEELLKSFFLEGMVIDSFDIIDFGDHKYSHEFKHGDFIDYYKVLKSNLIFGQQINSKYDYIISNPPYNCHEIDYIRNNKANLKKLFPQVGALNMYSMFLAAMIDLAKDGALIGVILSDSFLTARLHSGLRQKIFDECSIHHVILCPSELFKQQNADVRTVLLILQKGKQFQGMVQVKNRIRSTKELKDVLQSRNFEKVGLESIIFSKKEPFNQFTIGACDEINALFTYPRLGDVFKCLTGISTGNDGKYLSKVKKEGFSIPFYKNPGSRKFFAEPDAYIIDNFLEEGKKVKDFMVRNKEYLFKEGITCSSMGIPFSACYLPEQSTYGVNANIFPPQKDLFWLLSYLNSSLVTYLVRGILIRSNMITSGYVSQIPIPSFSEDVKGRLSRIGTGIVQSRNRLDVSEGIKEIDKIVFDFLGISTECRQDIETFCTNLYNAV